MGRFSKVKFLTKPEVEERAELLLKLYEPKKGETFTPPLDVDYLVETVLDLSLIVDNLCKKEKVDDILGALYVKDKGIVIDESLENNTGRFNFTCAHEVGHWTLHKEYLIENENQLILNFEVKKPEIICRRSSSIEMIEWQADFFAGALLMPRKFIINELNEILRNKNIPGLYELKNNEKERKVLKELSKKFGVSMEAMKVRLKIVGCYEEKQALLF